MKENRKNINPIIISLNIIKIIYLFLMIIYFLYLIMYKHGNAIANITFAIIYFAYFVFELLNVTNKYKKAKKIAKRNFRRMKLLVRLFTLVSLIYSIIVLKEKNPITIILFFILSSCWLMQIILELIMSYLIKQKEKFKERIQNKKKKEIGDK